MNFVAAQLTPSSAQTAQVRELAAGAAQPPALRVVAARTADELADHTTAWQDLADHAIEPNAFYEPWLLVPALKAFAASSRPSVVFIYRGDENRSPLLCGVFPLERLPSFKQLPIPVLRLWKHIHCFLCTPLVRDGHGPQTLDALARWAATDARGAPLLDLDFITGDGPFQQLLTQWLHDRRHLYWIRDGFTRALFRPAASAEQYLQTALSTGYRKEMRRLRRRLGELGTLQTRVLESFAELPVWLEYFLRLEASGWKGDAGTAMIQHERERRFIREAVERGFPQGKVMLQGLFLDGRPLAMQLQFRAGDGAFSFKTAFDESYGRFSPGVQAQLDNIHELHARPHIRWMDSCAIPHHEMINRLWRDRRTIHSVLVSTGGWRGDLGVSMLPLLRWLGRLLSGKQR